VDAGRGGPPEGREARQRQLGYDNVAYLEDAPEYQEARRHEGASGTRRRGDGNTAEDDKVI
jgi:hypothetical protein